MAVDSEAIQAITSQVERVFEEGRLRGQAESQQQFFGKAAAVLTAQLFVAAMEQAATAIRPHSAESADFFHEEARRIAAFVTPPHVGSHDPGDGATGIVLDAPIHVKFGGGGVRPDSLTEETFYVGAASGGPHLSAAISYDESTGTATLTPENPLSPNVEYRVTVGAVRASGGMPLDPPVTWTFTTAAD